MARSETRRTGVTMRAATSAHSLPPWLRVRSINNTSGFVRPMASSCAAKSSDITRLASSSMRSWQRASQGSSSGIDSLAAAARHVCGYPCGSKSPRRITPMRRAPVAMTPMGKASECGATTGEYPATCVATGGSTMDVA